MSVVVVSLFSDDVLFVDSLIFMFSSKSYMEAVRPYSDATEEDPSSLKCH